MHSSKRVQTSVTEAEEYIEAAESNYKNISQREDKIWNPVVVNCIMAMIKSVDALMLEKRGRTNSDQSKTSRSLQGLYDDGLISDNFKSNVDSVRKWVVDKKTAIQYKNEQISRNEADEVLKASKRLLKKTKKELEFIVGP